MTDDLDWTGRGSLLIGPLQSNVAFQIATSLSPASGAQLVPTPGALQYIRLYTMTVETFVDPIGHYCGDVTASWALTNDAQSITKAQGSVGGPFPAVPMTWPQGLVFPFGSGVVFIAGSALWADASLSISCTYTVVG